MRTHGMAQFPDPNFSGGKCPPRIAGLDPDSPASKAAREGVPSRWQPGGMAGKGGGTSEGGG